MGKIKPLEGTCLAVGLELASVKLSMLHLLVMKAMPLEIPRDACGSFLATNLEHTLTAISTVLL
jgi:hypothetical protein